MNKKDIIQQVRHVIRPMGFYSGPGIDFSRIYFHYNTLRDAWESLLREFAYFRNSHENLPRSAFSMIKTHLYQNIKNKKYNE